MNIFAEAGHTPKFSMRLDMRMFGFIPGFVRETLAGLPPVKRIVNNLLNDMGLPESVMMFMNYPTRYDNRDTERALKGSGISCPDLRGYAPVIWDYWERNLDPDLFIDHSLEGNVGGKIVLITGASSGIGKNAAIRLAEAGAHVLLVARSMDKLEETAAEIAELGGVASIYPCDASNLEDCDRLVAEVLKNHGHVDILVNNAGRSIRRAVMESLDRFHDYERTMQLNYFGCVRLINGLLPSMVANKSGHIINISSIGCLVNAPRFAAYVASKSALDAFSRSLSSEVKSYNIDISTIYMPLVRTPMIAPTKIYNYAPTWSVDKASDVVVDAAIHKTKRIKTVLGQTMEMSYAIAPKFNDTLLARSFQLFPSSAKARGKKAEEAPPSGETMALAYLLRGAHL